MQRIRKHMAEIAIIAITEIMFESTGVMVSSPMVRLTTPMDENSPDLKLVLSLTSTS
jgi:hypothetical protein